MVLDTAPREFDVNAGDMFQLNLNPAQAAKMRPQSASLRTPRSMRTDTTDPSMARMAKGDGQATPRQAPKDDVPEGEEPPWLFSFERPLTTLDIWKMGFSRVLVFGSHHWADEKTCCAELSEAFRATRPLTDLKAESKPALEAVIAPCFLKGDVLLAIQCTQLVHLSDEERQACLKRVGLLVDAVSNVWTQYDELSEPELGAVVVVLEGFDAPTLVADWGGVEEGLTGYPVSVLDEALSVFFQSS